MANTASAKKNVRQTATRRARNRWRMDRVRTSVKDLLDTMHNGKVEDAQAKITAIYKLLDQVASTKTIHRNTASRYKSRLTIRFNAMKAGKASGAAAPAAKA
ncbi:MAG: 30S ribosomal protein S20 [Planctomycetota bacterium]|nr:30S ribosomal protein S20 [Planctomycetota bacterium]